MLTPGEHDEQLPAWSPDGGTIAYVTKRGADPDRTLNYDIYLIEPRAGAVERQLTHFQGSDLDPYWESRPSWSPDGKRIAYLRSGEDKWIYYAPWQLAVVEVATGVETLPAPIDRCFYHPKWGRDGRSIYALIEQSRVTNVARIDYPSGRVTTLDAGKRFDFDLAVAPDGRAVVLGGDDTHPYELAAVERKGLRPLTNHNAWLAGKRLATARTSRSAVRTAPRSTASSSSRRTTSRAAATRRSCGCTAGRSTSSATSSCRTGRRMRRRASSSWRPIRAAAPAAASISRARSTPTGVTWTCRTCSPPSTTWSGRVSPIRTGSAVGGRSYGGILTNYVIASDTRFKAAVSGAGSSNMFGMYGHDMYIREYELELGTPWKNPDVYARVSYPFLHADRIRTPTLFYCADEDFNVPCLGAEQMYQALRSQDVPTQLVIYPGENHALTVPSHLRDRLERLIGWYGRFLKP